MESEFEIKQALLKAVGIPLKNVAWFEIRVAADEQITIKCGYYPEKKNMEHLMAVMEFELKEKAHK